LIGILGFADPVTIQSVSSETVVTEFTIPVVMTEPLNWKNVRVQRSQELEKLEVRPGQTEKGPVIRCRIENADVPAGGLGGTISLDHEMSGRSGTLTCIIGKQAAFDVSPKIIRFFPAKELGEYEATVFVRFKANPEGIGATGERPSIDCRLVGDPLQLAENQLADGVVRTKIRLLETMMDRIAEQSAKSKAEPGLVWHTRIEGKSHYVNNSFHSQQCSCSEQRVTRVVRTIRFARLRGDR
jgi:hypothetical protein